MAVGEQPHLAKGDGCTKKRRWARRPGGPWAGGLVARAVPPGAKDGGRWRWRWRWPRPPRRSRPAAAPRARRGRARRGRARRIGRRPSGTWSAARRAGTATGSTARRRRAASASTCARSPRRTDTCHSARACGSPTSKTGGAWWCASTTAGLTGAGGSSTSRKQRPNGWGCSAPAWCASPSRC